MIYPEWRQQLSRSLHLSRSKPEAKYFQVASITTDGAPALRTMVFRDHAPRSNSLLSVTDIRSEKCEQWKALAEAALHWYFVKSREQYRLRCRVSLIHHNEAGRIVCSGHELLQNIHQDGVIEASESACAGETLKLASSIFKARWEGLSSSAKASFYCPAPKSAKLSGEGDKINSDKINSDEINSDEASKKSSEGAGTKREGDQAQNEQDTISPHFAVVVFHPFEVDYLDLKSRPHTRNLYSLEQTKWLKQSVNP
ncbi:hypothetical protein ACFO4O_03805 [Glaciecola siphonariae]|uniref:Pyridoxamine 5'-phosphate oxidase Alr4036 family FMN-binding domain-containing protein n=1 Tax=Glaciecola siphonariae TaxID=521012 RepID=A0ABV9LS24_9ALTE